MLAQIHLNWLDFSAIAAYAASLLVMGLWFARQQQTSQDYLLAGRSMGWLVISISQSASLLSAISYLGTPGETYANDLKYVPFTICGVLVVPLAIFLFLNFFYGLGVVSIYEYLEKRFNYSTRLLAAIFFLLSRLCWMATIVSAVSIAVETLTGLDAWKSIVLTTFVATGYTLVGGMRAIVWTDVIQFVLYAAGLIGALLLVGQTDPADQLYQVMVRDQKLQMLDFSLDPTVRMTVWIALGAGAVSGLANMTDQVSMQRYLSCKSLREAQLALWAKPILSLPLSALLYLLGLSLYAHYQLNPKLAEGIGKPDQAFPHFILHEMPHGLAGLIIAAILAAAMSSIDSGIHTVSTVCIEDFYKRLVRPNASDRHCLALARCLIVFWGAVIVGIALIYGRVGSILDMMASLMSPFFGCAVGMFLLGTATRRANAWGTICGGLIGYSLVLWVGFCWHQVDGQWHFLPTASDPADVKVVSKFWYSFVSLVGTLVPGYLISLAIPGQAEKARGLNIWDRD